MNWYVYVLEYETWKLVAEVDAETREEAVRLLEAEVTFPDVFRVAKLRVAV